MNDLNRQARALLKESGHLSKEEFTFTIKKEIEDDFDRKFILQEKKGFSKGDRIVFTKNKSWSGIRNGTMGTITEINATKRFRSSWMKEKRFPLLPISIHILIKAGL
jgi:ATP-dependent exoDNAse (exonuclease V) alpha subunit